MIKVVYVVLSSKIAGTEMHVMELSKALNHNVYKPIIVNCGGELDRECKKNNLESYIVNEAKNIKMIGQIYRILKEINPDIVHAHLGISGLYGRIAAFLAGVKIVIYTDHAWASYNYNLSYFENKLHIYIYILLALKTKRIIGVSRAVCDYLVNTVGVSKNKVICIRNGTAINYELEMKKTINKPLNFCIVARLEEEKNHECLFQAVNKIKNEKFYLYIVGEGSREIYYKNLCKNLGIENQCVFLGHIDHERIGEIYNKMDVAILPSQRETFGLTLIEAMSYYLPCIGSNVGGIPEIIEHKTTGLLFKDNDVNDLVTCMEFFLKNREKVLSMGKEARCRVEREFSIDKMIKDIDCLYQEELKNDRYRNHIG